MKVVFMGTPEFSVPALEYLVKNHEVIGVFTQPDKPKGRGKKMASPPVKVFADSLGLNVFQPERIKAKENLETLKSLNPDVIIVIAYGQILSENILDLPSYGCINVHASLLPELRGASPINMAIVRGLKKTGITTMKMDIGLDTGDMLLKKEIDIESDMTAGELHDILKDLSSIALSETLENIETIIPKKQDDSFSSYAPIITKNMAEIDWNQSAKDIYNMIRGYNPWPVAYTNYNNKRLKIFKARIIDEETNYKAGFVIEMSQNTFKIQTKDKIIDIIELQLPGNKRMNISQFALGHKIAVGTILY